VVWVWRRQWQASDAAWMEHATCRVLDFHFRLFHCCEATLDKHVALPLLRH